MKTTSTSEVGSMEGLISGAALEERMAEGLAREREGLTLPRLLLLPKPAVVRPSPNLFFLEEDRSDFRASIPEVCFLWSSSSMAFSLAISSSKLVLEEESSSGG